MSTCKDSGHTHILIYMWIVLMWIFSGSKEQQEIHARQIETLESQVRALKAVQEAGRP